jgi:hypothetical protein
MSKFAIGEVVDNAADYHEVGTVIAVFPTVEGNVRYAVDMEGYGALQFFAEEKLVVQADSIIRTAAINQVSGLALSMRSCNTMSAQRAASFCAAVCAQAPEKQSNR